MDPVILRIDEPRELLAYVPHRLGFRPIESAVAVGLRGARARVGLVVRVDLDDLASPTHGPQLARTLAGHLGQDGATRVLLVTYTERDVGERLADRAAAHLAEACDVPVGPLDALLVTGGSYRCLACPPGCCPPGGRPLDDLRGTRVGAEMVLAGSVVADRREDVARIANANADARRSVARARRRWEAARLRAACRDEAAVAVWRSASLRAWREEVAEGAAPHSAVEGGPDGDEAASVDGSVDRTDAAGAAGGRTTLSRLGRIEAGLADRRVRDAVLVTLVPGTGLLPERSVRSPHPDPADDRLLGEAMARVADPSAGVPPPVTSRRHELVLEEVVAHGRRDAQAPALTLLGLLAWWRGDGARAGLLLERALEHDEAYRLAALLARALGAGLPPGWVRRVP
ncbi:DUF4192 domain-containing protein [Cellulomonas shaoxiangyii]|uniref:DUF4192 domain-containing protein n=1 Tax=Cellulomonas shaoxiangyii TaxID=2566013 RepID=A0A4P7SJW8_9CELL|nr:DUF4192 domain-containing protein [Cellulomonas shaoxiangyii]QCB93416.1 DUF4192 domain-containing protein [Cellulomonas shaoxiangyii]TGY84653.1 DUF4192 domain-containing protein [Cellulomonas shaoxiangyii]